MSKVDDNKIPELISHLRGTCKSIDHACEDLGFESTDLSIEQCSQIDQEIFECATCGWWCDISESNESEDGENECSDCNEEE